MNPLQSAKTERENLLKQRSEIDKRLEAVEQTIRILEPLYSDGRYVIHTPPTIDEFMRRAHDSGLTEQIRALLWATFPGPATPVAIRDLLVNGGLVKNLGERSNFLAEIHTVLKRLVVQGDAVPTPDGKGYRATTGTPGRYRSYRTSPPPEPPPGFASSPQGMPPPSPPDLRKK
jgi:hypothetical protein